MKIFNLILILIPHIIYAQEINSNFYCPDSICLLENVELLNASQNTENYVWDFCFDALKNEQSPKQVITLSESDAPEGIEIISDAGYWFGFVTSRRNNKIFRLDFGTYLNNAPSITDLGNIGGLASGPKEINFIKESDIWYGILLNANSNNLIRLSFGNSLTNIPSGTNLGNLSSWNILRGSDLVQANDSLILIVSSSINDKLTLVNFGNSITNTPGAQDILDIGVSEVLINRPMGVSIEKNGENWYGIVSSYDANKVVMMDFGRNLFNEPIFVDAGSINLPTDCELERDGETFYAIIQTRNSGQYRLDFGSSLNTIPALEPMNNVTGLSNIFNISLVRTPPTWKLFTIGVTDKTINKINFVDVCGEISQNSNTDFEPQNISYSSPGSYPIELTAYSAENGNLDTHLDTIVVRDAAAPTTSFTTTNTCITNQNTFAATSSDDPSVTSWSWDFGDVVGTASGQNVNYQYLDTGSYEVNLSIDAMNGCSNTARKIVSIYNPPQAGFTFPTGILCSNSPVDFINNTTFYGPDSIITYNWNFNEEALISSRDTSYNFSSGGDKTVTLSASIPGCSSETFEIINITPGPLTAFSSEGTCEYDVFQFTNSTTGSDITGYLWDFGDGYSSTNLSPTHQYASGGTYAVSLTAFNALGCQSILQQVVPVRHIPSPNFTNDLACSENTVKFYDQSTVPEANITEQFWTLTHNSSDFQASQTGPSPSFQLGEAGTYTLELVAKSNYGCVDTLVRNDVTVKPSPIADFSILETCRGDSTLFMEQAEFPDSTELNSAEWLIDGKLYSGPDVKHQFTLPDEYEIEMFLRSSNFCTDHITKTIQILPLPDLDIALSALCAEQPVSINALVNSPLDPVISYHWEIDNTPLSTSESFIYEFDDAQNYLISLEVDTENNCFNSLAQNFTIHPSPVSEFELFPSIGASPLEVSFTDLSFGASMVTYDFSDFNDDISHEFNPVYTYMELGKDWPKQIAENEFGCADTSYSEIEVVIPVYDLAITDTRIEVMDQKLSMIVELTNNGTIIVNNPDLHIDIDKTITLNHKLEGRLMPGDVQSFPIDFDVILDNKPINYLCFNLNMTFGDYEDVNPYDNTSCLSLENTVNVLEPYPNPSKEYVNLPIILPSGSNCVMTMTSEKGDIVYQKEFQALNEGLNLIRLDLATFAQGIYLVNIKLNDFETTKKVILR